MLYARISWCKTDACDGNRHTPGHTGNNYLRLRCRGGSDLSTRIPDELREPELGTILTTFLLPVMAT